MTIKIYLCFFVFLVASVVAFGASTLYSQEHDHSHGHHVKAIKHTTSSVTIVLAQHGVLANDIPQSILGPFFSLLGKVHYGQGSNEEEQKAFHMLEDQVVNWPRNPMNDPFWTSSYFIAKEIKERLQYPTFVGFNEFSSPTLPHALSQAAQSSSDLVIVVTPMLTPGGGHPERDIPLAIEKIQQSYPNIEIRYAWPNNPEEIETSLMKSVALLSEQVRSFSANSEGPVVLIQHGVPISGYSNEKLQTLIRECENQSASCKTLQEEYLGLAQNNKYWSSSMKMGKMMSEVLQREVYVGFNEFAYPTADMVLYEAALSYNKGPIDVVTSMLTQGGDHGEKDIPESLKRVSSKLGNTVKESFTFAWPYPVEKVANFLIDQIKSAHNED